MWKVSREYGQDPDGICCIFLACFLRKLLEDVLHQNNGVNVARGRSGIQEVEYSAQEVKGIPRLE